MRKLVEYVLISADGVFENPQSWGALSFRDEAYLRDGLGLLEASDAMLMGRRMYEGSVRVWPSRSEPWARRLNEMKKFVFSSTLERAEWNNTTIIRGDAATEVARLKKQSGPDLLIWGHTSLAESLFQQQLIDALDLSIHPIMAGAGKQFFRDGLRADLKLVATKSFSKIVKLSYEPQYSK